MFEIGDKVKVVCVPQKYKRKLTLTPDEFEYTGIVDQKFKTLYGVKLNGVYNTSSSSGIFWFDDRELTDYKGEDIMPEKMEKYNYVAIVNIVGGYNNKDYAFALYENEYDYCYDGCYVLVNPNNNITLATIKKVMTAEEYGKSVTKEVVGFCNINGYNDRIKARQEEAARQKKEAQLRKELDERISKLKDIEYYKRMAKELADKDPEIANLASELGAIM